MKFLTSILLSALTLTALPVGTAANEIRFSDGYNGSTYVKSESMTITYATKDVVEYSINGNVPVYYSDLSNCCANVAGAEVLGYYDRTYDNLIENFTAARVIRNKIFYNAPTQTVSDTIANLYNRMGTNSGSSGTTIIGFKNGLSSYVQDKGRQISYSSLGSYSKFNTNLYITNIENEIPAVLFMSKYKLVKANESSSSDEYSIAYYSGNHVLVGCGIKEVTYYGSNGQAVDTVKMLKVSTGYGVDGICYLELGDYGTIIDSYAVKIY